MSNLIPIGFYRAVAVPVNIDGLDFWAQFGETKDGKPQVAVQLAILDGPQQGRRATWYGYFSDKSRKRTLESLRLCGFKGDDLGAVMFQKINQEVSITVGHNTYDGKTTSRVDWVNAPGGGGVHLEKPMSKEQLRKFAAQLKVHAKAVPEVAGQATEAPAPGSGRATAEATSDQGGESADPPEDKGDDPWAGQEAPPPPDDSGIPF